MPSRKASMIISCAMLFFSVVLTGAILVGAIDEFSMDHPIGGLALGSFSFVLSNGVTAFKITLMNDGIAEKLDWVQLVIGLTFIVIAFYYALIDLQTLAN